jgi:hypothetical protein
MIAATTGLVVLVVLVLGKQVLVEPRLTLGGGAPFLLFSCWMRQIIV